MRATLSGHAAAFDVSNAGAIDLDQLEDLRGLFGAEAFSKLLVKFGDDLRRRLESIKGEPSRAYVVSSAHAMISAAGSLGFPAFSDLCRAVERIAQGDHDVRPSLVAFAEGANHVLQTIASITGSTES